MNKVSDAWKTSVFLLVKISVRLGTKQNGGQHMLFTLFNSNHTYNILWAMEHVRSQYII